MTLKEKNVRRQGRENTPSLGQKSKDTGVRGVILGLSFQKWVIGFKLRAIPELHRTSCDL